MIINRLPKYVILLAASVIVPLLVTLIIIMITGDRIAGMQYFIFPSIFIVHLGFAFTQLQKSKWVKVALGISAGILATLITLIPIVLKLKLNIDMYGYGDVIAFFAIGTVGSWEVIYQIDKKVKAKD